MRLDPFYLIVPDADWVERLVPLGVKLVQLRVKDTPEAALRSQIRRARNTCHRHGCQLIVNDHWQLAISEGCDFVHLGQEDLAEADVGAIRRAGLRLGVSTHDETELATALAAKPDYVALGPIWPTILKKMPWAQQTPARLVAWKKAVGDLPLVAIGGVTVERLPEVFAQGADVAAVVTDITLNADPEARTRQWIAATRAYVDDAGLSLPDTGAAFGSTSLPSSGDGYSRLTATGSTATESRRMRHPTSTQAPSDLPPCGGDVTK
ncbi:thiamine phosphate synthase [Jiella sp. 40Bstr34]|uniref:Thiamine-phosphate synthase n=1 Tax=Jiella pacifica TaxID=2696469 RepID=A0A6N9SZ21_9HYPH|nr:thiamine phosphate synthase [Jiella pacifica]